MKCYSKRSESIEIEDFQNVSDNHADVNIFENQVLDSPLKSSNDFDEYLNSDVANLEK